MTFQAGRSELIVVLAAAAVFLSSPAHPQAAVADSLIRRADSLLTLDEAAQAAELAEQAVDLTPGSRHAHVTLGRAWYALGKWSDACDEFEDLIERDTADVLAHYFLARSRRELGTTKSWLLRMSDWSTARDHFLWVFRRDSSYRDGLYQYALLLSYDEKHVEAIAAGHAQVRLRPDLAEPKVGLYGLYRRFILRRPDEAAAWLETQQTSISRIFLAEAWRRAGKVSEAETLLNDMLAGSPTMLVTPVYLSLARISAMKGRPDSSALSFFRAVNGISSNLAADLVFDDLKYLVTDEEYDQYRRLTMPDERILFFKAFWDRRNPEAVGSGNSRIGEHYLRLVRAEKDYEYTGFRNSFSNPDRYHELKFPRSYALNREFNDQGLLYIRHGQPDNIIRSVGMEDASETWVYEANDRMPRRMMHFAKRNTTANYWRLIPYPESVALITDLQAFDVRFRDLISNNSSAAERMKDEVIEESQTTVKAALSSENHTYQPEVKAFDIPVSVDAFRSKDERSMVDISYALPLASLAHGLPPGQQKMPVELALAIRTASGRDLIAKSDTLPLSPPKLENGMYLGLYRFLLPPGSYALALHARSLSGAGFGTWKGTKRIAAQSPALTLSDIEFLLPSLTASTLEIDGVKVVPSALQAYSLDRPLMIYYHAYNLVLDMFGATASDARTYLTKLEEGSVSIPFDPENPPEGSEQLEMKKYEGHETTSANFASIDVSGLSAGRYQLTVVFTDRKQHLTITGTKSVILVSPP
jgi:tetratricopeptide (TPR) repeat protein